MHHLGYLDENVFYLCKRGIYATHFTFGVYFWKLHVSNAFTWFQGGNDNPIKKQYTRS